MLSVYFIDILLFSTAILLLYPFSWQMLIHVPQLLSRLYLFYLLIAAKNEQFHVSVRICLGAIDFCLSVPIYFINRYKFDLVIALESIVMTIVAMVTNNVLRSAKCDNIELLVCPVCPK